MSSIRWCDKCQSAEVHDIKNRFRFKKQTDKFVYVLSFGRIFKSKGVNGRDRTCLACGYKSFRPLMMKFYPKKDQIDLEIP